MLLISAIIITISFALIGINFILAKKESTEREKPSPFECGFDPMNSARLPFSVQFFLVAVIFLIFDVELTLILPAVISLLSMEKMVISIVLASFLSILFLGLFLEWTQKALEWYI